MAAPRTIFLVNKSSDQRIISVTLNWWLSNQQKALRRPRFSSQTIKPGQRLDVCRALDVDYETACAAIRSEDVIKLEKRGRLAIVHWPPTVAEVEAQAIAVVAASEASAVNMATVTSAPDAKPEGIPQAAWDEYQAAKQVVPDFQELDEVVAGAADGMPVDELAQIAAAEAAAAASESSDGTPTGDWSNEKIRRWAEEHSIDLKGAATKAIMLRVIKEQLR